MDEKILVRDVMMPNFTKMEGVTKVDEALLVMKEKKVNAVLIEPRNDSDVFGIATLKDIARKVIAHNRNLHEVHLYEIMSKPVLSVSSEMPLPYAARFLTNFNVSYAMVYDNNDVIGMISLNGIVTKWALE
ncbi:MAG: CBS domain-containing protein [Nitrospinaceae bacterium]|jgi:CBS domain-containing protein|nr:CBS domain-containing protein [Nitrospinaceae bacterium]MDP7058472.1 CBS domain-containing protein [Nitrospinaceae bacterium]HAK37343.1 CBS domain-containing protein [Nitrospina sp.]|tara:strand:- start:2719 stop:3111 length:393 start_codon:yes stop_codon:yes gene_type:complete